MKIRIYNKGKFIAEKEAKKTFGGLLADLGIAWIPLKEAEQWLRTFGFNEPKVEVVNSCL